MIKVFRFKGSQLKIYYLGCSLGDDELYVNHILLLARQYLYSCRCNKKLPRIRIFIARINIAYQLETVIAKSNVDRLSAHYSKWGKYVNTLSVWYCSWSNGVLLRPRKPVYVCVSVCVSLVYKCIKCMRLTCFNERFSV